MAKRKTPYERLGVGKNADVATIKKAHRKRAMESHPDRGGDKDEFDGVQSAYMVLADPLRRKQYDETGVEDQAREVPIHAVLQQLFIESLQRIGDPGSFKNRDIVKMMLGSARDKLATASNEALTIKKVVEAIGDSLKRLNDPKGILVEMMARQKSLESSRVPPLEEQVRILGEAVVYLESCRYNAEQLKSFNGVGSVGKGPFGFTSSGSW